jgi:hypothetical protein
VIFVTLYVNGTKWARWAKILAGSTTDAKVLVDRGYLARFQVAIIRKNHRDGSRRAVTLAVAAIHIVGEDDTILAIPLGVTDLDR